MPATAPRASSRWASWWPSVSTKHAPRVLAVGLATLGLLCAGLSSLELETHAERFLAVEHPARVRYEAFKEEFGLDTGIFVLIEAPDVFAPAFLAKLADFHDALEAELSEVEEVSSLAGARLLEGGDDLLRVNEVRDALPRSAAEADRLAKRLLETTAYPDHLFASDRTLTAVAIRLPTHVLEGDASEGPFDPMESAAAVPLSARRQAALVAEVDALAARKLPASSYRLAGNPVVNARLAQALARDLVRFTALAGLAIAACLALLFRRLSAVLLPLAIVLATTLATLGTAGHLGLTLNVAVQILPPFLLAIGASAAIHLLVCFYRALDRGVERTEAVVHALERTGPAIGVTAATTAVGLGSFAAAVDLAPVALLGQLAPIGVALTLLGVLVLLPAALALLPIAPAKKAAIASPVGRLGRLLARIGVASMHRPALVLGLSALLAAVAFAGAWRLQATNDALAYFPPDDPIRSSTALFDDRLSGSLALEIVVDTHAPGGVRSPDLIAALDRLAERAPAIPDASGARVERVLSIVDVLREIHRALTAGDPEASALPDDRALIAQELLLFEASGSDDLERFVSGDDARARVTLRVPWVPAQRYLELIPRVEATLGATLPDGVTIATTGLVVVFAEAVTAISRGFASSYGTAIVLITLLMIAFLRSVRGGLVSMVPNVLPIALTLGGMGFLGIDLDLFTMLIGSIAIGLAVDDTIHLSHAFRRGVSEHGDLTRAVAEGLETTGSAILTSSIVLCLGFGTFLLSSMSNLAEFGLLTAAAIALALAIDVVVLPPLFAWTLRGRATGKAGAHPKTPPLSTGAARRLPS